MTKKLSRRARLITAAAVVAIGAITAGSITAARGRTDSAASERRSVQRSLDEVVAHGVPGAMAWVNGRAYAAGTANLETGRPLRVNSDGSGVQVRIGSNTKLYVAVAVLQLVQDGRVSLDQPISHYLPGIVSPAGTKNPVDGSKITVRNLLQHTAGLVDYLDLIISQGGMSADQVLTTLRKTYTNQELLQVALKQGELFTPGAQFHYSNTDYLLLGMLVEKVTGQSLTAVISDRIIRPLHLTDTYVPKAGLGYPDGPHGYVALGGKTLTDVSIVDPSSLGAAGNMISSIRDASRFTHAVVSTDALLGPAMRKQMTSNLVDAHTMTPGAAGWQYGLGIVRIALPCGGYAWGHPGQMVGYLTWPAEAPGRGTATVSLTEGPMDDGQALQLGVLHQAFCARS